MQQIILQSLAANGNILENFYFADVQFVQIFIFSSRLFTLDACCLLKRKTFSLFTSLDEVMTRE